MLFLYNIITLLAAQLLKIVALFSPKMKLFVDGRKEVFPEAAGKPLNLLPFCASGFPAYGKERPVPNRERPEGLYHIFHGEQEMVLPNPWRLHG